MGHDPWIQMQALFLAKHKVRQAGSKQQQTIIIQGRGKRVIHKTGEDLGMQQMITKQSKIRNTKGKARQKTRNITGDIQPCVHVSV